MSEETQYEEVVGIIVLIVLGLLILSLSHYAVLQFESGIWHTGGRIGRFLGAGIAILGALSLFTL